MSKHYKGWTPEHRSRAGKWLKQEVAAGRRSKATRCMACGITEGILDNHSEDYSEPFGDNIGAYQFCFRCHLLWHGRNRRPEGWTAYKVALRAGAQFPPSETRSLGPLAQFATAAGVARAAINYGEQRIPMLFDQPPFLTQ